ncbi:MAG: hypothetical protein BroJett024_43230 [Alphaproteobacteria bacterium]|nr:MAG: hypothetical protein BroJett024_43230 [Alphaproteobacteria bacterium]
MRGHVESLVSWIDSETMNMNRADLVGCRRRGIVLVGTAATDRNGAEQQQNGGALEVPNVISFSAAFSEPAKHRISLSIVRQTVGGA